MKGKGNTKGIFFCFAIKFTTLGKSQIFSLAVKIFKQA